MMEQAQKKSTVAHTAKTKHEPTITINEPTLVENGQASQHATSKAQPANKKAKRLYDITERYSKQHKPDNS